MIKISDFDYNLPEELVAQIPADPRDSSRLLVYKTADDEIIDEKFFNLGNFLSAGDLLVVNNSKVIPARIFGKKETGLPANASHQAMQAGGKIEILLLEMVGKFWDVLIGGKISIGEKIIFENDFFAKVISRDGKEASVKFNISGTEFWKKINQIGIAPLPPYIKNSPLSEPKIQQEYQTVYAKKFGSVAAPTAGLHFTKELIEKLKSAGINFASVDLHVGLGTFLPINDENIKTKKLHREYFSIPAETIAKIIETKKSGGRIVAVGTTTVRALESFWKDQKSKIKDQKLVSSFSRDDKSKIKKDLSGSTDIFIQPGFDFQIVDGLITNFHLPKSCLMMLVAAFIDDKNRFACHPREVGDPKIVSAFLDIDKSAKNNFDSNINNFSDDFGQQKLLELYNFAIKNHYRFYSFGDAMLII